MRYKESIVQIMILVERMMSGEEIERYFRDKIGLIQWSLGMIQGQRIAKAMSLTSVT